MLIDSSYNALTGQILSAAIEVHRTLGPGLLESTYLPCLQFELTARKLRFVTQRSVPIVYKGMRLDAGYRLDLIVEDAVVVEVKSVATLLAVHQAQVVTYFAADRLPCRTADQLQRAQADGWRKAPLTPSAGEQRRSGCRTLAEPRRIRASNPMTPFLRFSVYIRSSARSVSSS